MKVISIIVFKILILNLTNCANITAQNVLPPIPQKDSNLLDLVPHVAEGIPVLDKNKNGVDTVRF